MMDEMGGAKPLSIFETSVEVKKSEQVLRAMIRRREIETFRTGRWIWIRPTEVERLKRLFRGEAA